jgi:hypothetical protein
MPTTTKPLTAGIPDPEGREQWLVRPWPAGASFCDVVQHFQMAWYWRLWGETTPARDWAYYEGYQTALLAAPAPSMEYAATKRWYDDMLDCTARCVAIFRDKYVAEYGRDPQVTEDQHVKAVKRRSDSQ